jgi:hypothetical protein
MANVASYPAGNFAQLADIPPPKGFVEAWFLYPPREKSDRAHTYTVLVIQYYTVLVIQC